MNERTIDRKDCKMGCSGGNLARRRICCNRHPPLWSYRMSAKEANHNREFTHSGFDDAAVCLEILLTELATRYISVESSMHSLSTACILSKEYHVTISLTENSLDCSKNQHLLLLTILSSFG